MYRQKKIGVIIPALNEEESLPMVIQDIPKYVDTIVITDNGSTDNTDGVIVNYAEKDPRIKHCKEPNRGYGNACLKGMEKINNEDIIVFLDADYCEYPEKMNLLLDPIIDNNYDMVLANRHHNNSEKNSFTVPQKWGTKFIVWCIKILWGYKYHDLGPFRAIKRKILFTLGMADKNYGWTMEMQIKALYNSLQVKEINLPYKNRRAGKSKVSGTVRGVIGAGLKMIFRLFYYKAEQLFFS